jgi:hypothetical protein
VMMPILPHPPPLLPPQIVYKDSNGEIVDDYREAYRQKLGRI